MTYQQKVTDLYQRAYSTFGIEMFSNKKVWRIQSGEGKFLGKGNTETMAWKNACKNLKLIP